MAKHAISTAKTDNFVKQDKMLYFTIKLISKLQSSSELRIKVKDMELQNNTLPDVHY